MEVETHPHNVWYVYNPLGSPTMRVGNTLVEARDSLSPCDEQMNHISETQLNAQNVNKGVAYLTMLARIGLDSPS